MIPKENIYKETTISFKGQLVPFDYIIHSLTSCKITRNEAATILNDLRGFFENNINLIYFCEL